MRRLAAIWLTAVLLGISGAAGAQGSGPVADKRDAIAVVIGNRHYANGIPEVRYAANDAAAVRRFVIDVLGYRDGNVIQMVDASQAEMFAVFGNGRDHRGKLWSWVRPGRSDVLVYYSGHGVPGLRDRRGYLLPVDADPATPEINGYPLDLLLQNLAKIDTRSTTVLLDACFSGNSAAGWLVRAASPVYVKTAPPAPVAGLTLVTAAQGDQVASWDEQARLGLFTRHLLDALRGAADRGRDGNRDGAVTVAEVERYLDDEMSYAARRQFRRVQKASVSGDPKTVLVAAVPARPAGAGPAPSVTAPPPPPAGPAASAGPARYAPPGRDGARALAFLDRHRPAIKEAIRAYYREQGSAWDHKSIAASLDFAEDIAWFRGLELVAVRDDGMDIRASYAWVGNGRDGDAVALFRLRVTPNELVAVKMWR
ncbi:hypothetical protein GCM10017083_53180 [Thalassobaculum fulvum]|uniref:Peptidase C14 caspase domain-containing protein n=1 Tax=Thalassobaculum fulvum TaxID=1633335 RepID=A0A918XY73_9PROT|nr:caspase family protein [Thalassobaculum fulvum]GHD63230.1 hypothetical protein GCM10017083_53180 [Thalassobaculum fulvum]